MLDIKDIYAKDLQDYINAKYSYQSIKTKEYISVTKALKIIDTKYDKKISEFLKTIFRTKNLFFVSYLFARDEYIDILDYKIHNKLKVISLERLLVIDFDKLKQLMKPIINFHIYTLQKQLYHKSEY